MYLKAIWLAHSTKHYDITPVREEYPLSRCFGYVFFDDNIMCLQKGNPFGERLAKIAKKNAFDGCDQCAVRRGLADGTFEQCGSGQVRLKD